MIDAASSLVHENNKVEVYRKVQSSVNKVLSSLLVGNFAHHKRQFAELNIVAWMKADELNENLWNPNVLAEMFVDLYKATPQLHRKVLKSSDKHNNGPIAIHKYILWDETLTISLWHSM